MNNTSLQTTWNELLRALHAPIDQDFNPFYWIYRLGIVVLDSIIPCRSHDRRQKLHGSLRWIRPVIPAVGIALIGLCGWSYFSIFRYTVVRKRWCRAETATAESSACHWETSHACLVIFFVVNIIGQYLWCIFRSPGVVEAVPGIHSEGTNSFDIEHSNQQSSTTIYHPDPNPTYCKRCELNRPARAHHCRVCNKCILQYDHHCPWVNNCIGYNNYRSFVLLVFHLMAGCTYGVILLGRDFFEMMKRRIELYGWSIRGAVHGTGLLDLPLPWVLWREYQSNGYIDRDVVLRAAFPLMFLVGIFMYWFLGYHLKIIIHGYTTLEDASRPRNEAIVNPYDNGPRNNLKKVFGTSWVRLLLPLSFLPPDQFSKPRT